MRFRVDPASAGSKNIDLRSKFLKPLYLLSGIVGLILSVVCVNLAGLTLVRASARRHEVSTRTSLGATPWQAIRQLVLKASSLDDGRVVRLAPRLLGQPAPRAKRDGDDVGMVGNRIVDSWITQLSRPLASPALQRV